MRHKTRPNLQPLQRTRNALRSSRRPIGPISSIDPVRSVVSVGHGQHHGGLRHRQPDLASCAQRPGLALRLLRRIPHAAAAPGQPGHHFARSVPSARARRCTLAGQALARPCAPASGATGSTWTAVALHSAITGRPGARPSNWALSAVMRAAMPGASPPPSGSIQTRTWAPCACRAPTRQGHRLRMLVRRPSPSPGAAEETPAGPPKRCSTCARACSSASAMASRDCPAAVMRAPPPPAPPTERSTRAQPARLVSTSSACHAAL